MIVPFQATCLGAHVSLRWSLLQSTPFLHAGFVPLLLANARPGRSFQKLWSALIVTQLGWVPPLLVRVLMFVASLPMAARCVRGHNVGGAHLDLQSGLSMFLTPRTRAAITVNGVSIKKS